MAHTHIVARPFEGAGGRQYKTGEKVDASDWRNTDVLVKRRNLQPLYDTDVISLKARVAEMQGQIEEQGRTISELRALLEVGAVRPKRGRKPKEVRDGGQ